MGIILRGFKNAFRNWVRTFSVVLILALAIGLALSMLVSLRSVQARIDSVKSSIGNFITVSPAGARGFEGGGSPLTVADIAKLGVIPHVVKVTENLNARLASTDTNLTSSVDAGTIGGRQGRFFGRGGNFTPPIMAIGTSDPTTLQALGGGSTTLTSGALFDGNSDSSSALLGKDLATKNNLTVGGNFQMFGQNVTVAGIFDSGNRFTNNGVVLPIKTLQKLAGQSGEVSQAVVQTDSIGSTDAVVTDLKNTLGDKADVVSQQDTSNEALTPLENIKDISLYSLIGALVAGAVIIFLIMLMTVRERRREIGVLKAIGAPDWKVVGQVLTESLVLTSLATAIGLVAGAYFSGSVTRLLVENAQGSAGGGPGGFGGATRAFGQAIGFRTLTDVQSSVGSEVLLYGLLAALAIAVIGSSIPAYLTARIRPAEVLRSE